MVGSPYNHAARFDQAIEEGKVELAWTSAANMAEVRLDQALRLTVLLAHSGDCRFLPAARRFIARFSSEAEPTLGQIKKVADALDCLRLGGDNPALREGADRALDDLARQLGRA